MRRAAVTVLAFALLPATAEGASPSLTRRARSVLGDDGPVMADRVIAKLTPGCPSFETAEAAEAWSNRIRQEAIDAIGLDLGRRIVNFMVSRTLEMPDYRVEVLRIETFPGIYMPVNMYIPNEPPEKKLPLVITPIACGAALWSPRVQRRAANLATLGIVVITTEGFCDNGMRAMLPESDRHVGYARQMLGMRGAAFSAYLQELISTITWAQETFPYIDRDRVGAVGSSYGGQVAMMLAQLDARIRTVSVAGTYLGEPCDGFPLKSDIHMETQRPPHVWVAPLEVPVLATNWRLLTVFPRAVHVTSGENDMSAPPNVIGGAMAYASEVYALAGHEDLIEYATDSGKHAYNPKRRQSARNWMAQTLLGELIVPPVEVALPVRSRAVLAPDTSKTGSLFNELKDRIAKESRTRFDDVDDEVVRQRVDKSMKELFASSKVGKPRVTLVYEHSRGAITVTGKRMQGELVSFPVVIFEGNGEKLSNGKTLLYLPKQGTQNETMTINGFLSHYDRVISIDYLGIGELKSGRMRLHTIGRYLMHNDPSLPQINVDLLRSFVAGQTHGKLDVWATNWPTSFYAACLKWLAGDHIDKIYLQGLPPSELRFFQSRKKVPDLLLWGGLFAKVSVQELAVAIGEDAKLVR